MLNKFEYFIQRNGKTILTIMATGGVVSTVYFAIKATPRAIYILEDAKNKKGSDLTKMEIVKNVWKQYIPCCVSAIGTIGCIIGINYVSKRREATLLSAYTLLKSTYDNYRENVNYVTYDNVKSLSNNGLELELKDVIDAKYNPDIDKDDDSEKLLFFDYESCRFFKSTIHHVMKAEVQALELLSSQGYLLLNQYYDLLGIPRVDFGYTIGWEDIEQCDPYNCYPLEFQYEKIMIHDNIECRVIRTNNPPTFDYILP